LLGWLFVFLVWGGFSRWGKPLASLGWLFVFLTWVGFFKIGKAARFARVAFCFFDLGGFLRLGKPLASLVGFLHSLIGWVFWSGITGVIPVGGASKQAKPLAPLVRLFTFLSSLEPYRAQTRGGK
jgi:hypothetical protein